MTVGEEKLLYNELRKLRTILERIEALLEERLIGIEESLPDEIEAMKEYKNDKKKGETKLVNLNDLLTEKDWLDTSSTSLRSPSINS